MGKKNKILIILGVLIFIILLIIFFLNGMTKTNNIGNNSSSQDVVNHILNISSYEVEIEAKIHTNKNTNKYKMKQSYIDPDICVQEIIEPANIEGVKIIREGNNIKLENTNLKLSSVFEKYEYMGDNSLDLSTFIEDYKSDSKSSFKEEDEKVIMQVVSKSENKYTKNKTLYIDKNTGNPIKMEINDTNKKNMVYILYNKVKINSTKKEDIIF